MEHSLLRTLSFKAIFTLTGFHFVKSSRAQRFSAFVSFAWHWYEKTSGRYENLCKFYASVKAFQRCLRVWWCDWMQVLLLSVV